MSQNTGQESKPKSWTSVLLAVLALLTFLGFASVYDIIPREWIPKSLQPRSWREEQPYYEVDRSDLPFLLGESFEDANASQRYVNDPRVTIENGRLSFFFPEAGTGHAVQLPGEYQRFSLAFTVYPVGEMFDESVNILYQVHDAGWYEIWIRLRQNYIFAFETDASTGFAWKELVTEKYEPEKVVLGPRATRVQLDVQPGEHVLYINGERVAVFRDETEPFLRGQIKIGAGAGKTPNVGVEIDDVEIRAR